MAGEFDFQPLGSVAKVRSGYAFKSEDMGAVGLAVIKIKNVVPPTVDITDCVRVPEDVVSSIPRVERFELKEGDTLIAMTGATVGKVGRFPRTHARYFLNQRVGKVYLTEPDAADYRYIYYILSQDSYVRQMFGIADGSAQANISGSQIESLDVPLPPLPTQRAIAHILGTLDDLIELNRETNEILEEMARALFKSWFVDFDPVRRNKDEGGRMKDENSDTSSFTSHPSSFDHLFPDHFQDSELGEIPRGWEVGKVSDLATLGRVAVNPGRHPEEFFDHYSLPAFDDGRNPKTEIGSAIMSNKFLVEPDSVLLSKLNPHIPRVWLPDLEAKRRSVCSTEFMVAKATPGVSREYLFSLFTDPYFASIYGTLVSGTTGSHQRISPDNFIAMQVVTPSAPLIEAFTEVVKPMFNTIHSNLRESRDLATLRDTLLPKLLSGEVKAPTSAP